ncbi:hypothetical protein D3C71_1771860 [compost metagenome]
MEKELITVRKMSFSGFEYAKNHVIQLLAKLKRKEVIDFEADDGFLLEMQMIKLELDSAMNSLNYATNDQQVDIAVEELSIAERKMEVLIKRAKMVKGIPFAEREIVKTAGK